jgi:hypothetical protein
MVKSSEHSPQSQVDPDVHERWVKLYGPLLAARLSAHRRYSLVRVGSVEFAYTDSDGFVRALQQIWEAGFVPEPRPSCLGTELPHIAPRLRGVDCDLSDLTPADLDPPNRRFSR